MEHKTFAAATVKRNPPGQVRIAMDGFVAAGAAIEELGLNRPLLDVGSGSGSDVGVGGGVVEDGLATTAAFSVIHLVGSQPIPGQASAHASNLGIGPPTKGTNGASMSCAHWRTQFNASHVRFQNQARFPLSLENRPDLSYSVQVVLLPVMLKLGLSKVLHTGLLVLGEPLLSRSKRM
jgi:hypothetical protein